jgi:hypothetical protein
MVTIVGSSRMPGNLRHHRVPNLMPGYLDTTFLERLPMSMPMASRLFKAVGVGATMPGLILVASGQCRLCSSDTASTI